MEFEPTRTAGLRRLEAFAPTAGREYQHGRNFDLSAGDRSVVSRLSPWLRHRLVSEWEVLQKIRAHHDTQTAASFIQEVFWRGYFKGWLEQHPSVWDRFQANLALQSSEPSDDYRDAIHARTGISCFDHWCTELRRTGYLHNHARMWFASIWIFTLRLPWEMGAAFFLETLTDGDPASNTLSWRWVAGLHTKGKHYLATAENIARFTDGRFCPKGQLNENAGPLIEDFDHTVVPVQSPRMPPPQNALRLITEEDCLPALDAFDHHAAVLGIVSPNASAFAKASVRETTEGMGGEVIVGHKWSQAIAHAADRSGTRDVVTAYLPTGFVKDGMRQVHAELSANGIRLHNVLRPYDAMVWPHASKGFFKLKKQIPQFMAALSV